MKPWDEQKIVAAAIKQGDLVCFVPKPGRHHDVIRKMAAAGIPIPITGAFGLAADYGINYFIATAHLPSRPYCNKRAK